MASESDFAGIQNANLEDSVAYTRRWAEQKFGRLVSERQLTDAELFDLWDYYRQHPGAPDSAAVSVIDQARKNVPKPAPTPAATAAAAKQSATSTAGKNAAQGAALAGDNEVLSAAIDALPPEALDPKSPTGDGLNWTYIASHTNDPAVKALLQARRGGGDATAVLDKFDAKTPVYVTASSGHPTSGGAQSTYGQVLTDFYKMDAGNLKALKQRLWDGGFYPAGTSADVVNSSVPDVATKTAYEIAVQQAARLAEAGQPWTVDAVIASGNPDPAKATGASTIGPYYITNPADLKTALNSAAQERLGRDLAPDEISTFAKLYQGMEAQSSTRYQAANRNNQQLGVVNAPAPSSAAQDYLDTHFRDQEQAYGAVHRQFAFYDLLGGLQ